MLSLASEVYIYFPGGFGTMDELFEMLTLIQTKKIPPTPVILVKKHFWQPFLDYIKKHLLIEHATINKKEFDMMHVVDSVDEAFKLIKKLVK